MNLSLYKQSLLLFLLTPCHQLDLSNTSSRSDILIYEERDSDSDSHLSLGAEIAIHGLRLCLRPPNNCGGDRVYDRSG